MTAEGESNQRAAAGREARVAMRDMVFELVFGGSQATVARGSEFELVV